MALAVAHKHLVAKFETPCATCNAPILQGESMFPASDSVCKHWERMGVCFYKDRCVFRHPAERLEELQRVAARQAAFKAARRTTNDIRCKENRGPGKRNRVRNRFRAGTLRRWLLDAVGEDRLRRGSGILDVAAGKGELAFEFLNLNGIPSTALEPRPLQLERHVKWLQRGYYNWNAVFAPYNSATAEGAQGRVAREQPCDMPAHLRMVATPAVAACLGIAWPGGPDAVSREAQRSEGGGAQAQETAEQTTPRLPCLEEPPAGWERAYAMACEAAEDLRWTHRGLRSDHESAAAAHEAGDGEPAVETQGTASSIEVEESFQTPTVADDGEADGRPLGAAVAWRALRGASAVVAMHPDQATEFAVDLALALDVPMAVVPCCVYASDFPHRRLPDGRRVTSHEDFVEYLCSKHPSIGTATLPFEGKNTLVFRR
ncbi:hypothetical protein F751_1212 [Auxenochlorella protothecoides]|uniref:C3H1-type domain-containing protein n=2 Tax=Auxenochlorella protothecoides TaxID=3075 RepID=A0A087SNY1_AUXPR|nr:hypothetical protein F751_1212 [Auxenochlorella protothecoides]KFM27435.1 hypothetical protein F751_1212 [Auxenochlorella protothecoides]